MARLVTIARALRDAGLLVAEHDGWTTRGDPDFDPVGVMAHHTAGPATGDAPSLNTCIKGRPDLPGPLCHIVLSRSGICHVIAAGRANHAGVGSWKGVSGNRRFLGIEAENTGRGEPWPAGQVSAYVTATAALLRLIGRDASWCVGHKEYAPGRKIDPAGLDMGWFRLQVEKHLSDAAADLPIPPPLHPPVLEDFMADPHGTARMLFRLYLGRNPNDQAELDYHVIRLVQVGLNARCDELSQSPEGRAWEAKLRAA